MRLAKSIGGSVGLVVLSLMGSTMYGQTTPATTTLKFVTTNTTTFGSAPFNFTGDGVANFAWYTGTGELGRVTGQGISQTNITGRACRMPDGTTGVEGKLTDHVAVTRFEDTGDLLYERGKPGDLTACLNFQTGAFIEGGTVSIIGGTGRFKGATGSYVAEQEGQILVPPGSDKLQFGYATAKYTFTVTVPAGNRTTLPQTAAVAGPKELSTSSPSIQLDGSRSTSADGKALTYQWTIPQGAPSVALLGGNTSTPVVQFPRGRATYTFQLTVTDTAGKSSTDFIVVEYVGN